MNILIAGGSGLIGGAMAEFFSINHEVRILSRSEKKSVQPNVKFFQWNPAEDLIDTSVFKDLDIIINLSGAGIADKKWTSKRKIEIIDSRVEPTQFLFNKIKKHNVQLKRYMSASGINCYGWEERNKVRTEEDPFGSDFLSQTVEKWENSARLFEKVCPITIIRISMVLSASGGALDTLKKPVKYYVGSSLGKGKQFMPWIHIDDLVQLFAFCIDNDLDGVYNANASEQVTNKMFMKLLNKKMGKKSILPPAPSFVMKWIFGEMAEMLLEGIQVSNEKIKSKGFTFKYSNLDEALNDVI